MHTFFFESFLGIIRPYCFVPDVKGALGCFFLPFATGSFMEKDIVSKLGHWSRIR
jgi:hypothetical protein